MDQKFIVKIEDSKQSNINYFKIDDKGNKTYNIDEIAEYLKNIGNEKCLIKEICKLVHEEKVQLFNIRLTYCLT